MEKFKNAIEAVKILRPDEPVYCFRPDILRQDYKRFTDCFPGETAYAVKTNGEPIVVEALAKAGLREYDVASPAEFEVVNRFAPDAKLLYMHPVKAVSHIRLAIEKYDIRVFAVDHEGEILKIFRVVRALDLDPSSITIFVRLQTKGHAAYELSKKFGAAPTHAAELLQRAHNIGFQCGLCFHVGSQIESHVSYLDALKLCATVRDKAGVPLVGLDIGGGFPADYGVDPKVKSNGRPELEELMHLIMEGIKKYGFEGMPLVAEPGRVVVARTFSLIVRVLLRKGKSLYINDGVWASLSDSWTGKITLPARFIPDNAVRRRSGDPEKIVPFKVCGATCDSVDILSRPFWLPETISTGDWIEIGNIGAYSLSLRTHFNGFYPDRMVELEEPFEAGDKPVGLASIESPADELEYDQAD